MCNCIAEVDKKLAERNCKITRGICLDFDTGKSSLSPPSIVIKKIESKKRTKLPTVLCSYCPFCGKKYDD